MGDEKKYNKLRMIQGVGILFSPTSNVTARGQLVALKGDGYRAMRQGEHFTKSKELCPRMLASTAEFREAG